MKTKLTCAVFYLFFISGLSAKAISCSDSTKLKGYLIIEADKKEILNLNRLLNKNNASAYRSPVDIESESLYFLPCDTNEKLGRILQTKKRILTSAAYIIPSNESKDLIDKYCKGEKPVIQRLDLTLIRRSNDWVTTKDFPDKVFKIFYLESKAISAKIKNSALNENYLDLRYKIQPSLEFFACYFMTSPIKYYHKIFKERDIKKLIGSNSTNE